MTKEELIAESAKLNQSNINHAKDDEKRRAEFGKAFNWKEAKTQYSYTESYYVPTWTEIFIELGRLLASRRFQDCKDDIENLDSRVRQLEQVEKSYQVKQ